MKPSMFIKSMFNSVPIGVSPFNTLNIQADTITCPTWQGKEAYEDFSLLPLIQFPPANQLRIF